MKAKAVVADAQPEFGRVDALELLYVALSRCREFGEGMKMRMAVGWSMARSSAFARSRQEILLKFTLSPRVVRFEKGQGFDGSPSHALEIRGGKPKFG